MTVISSIYQRGPKESEHDWRQRKAEIDRRREQLWHDQGIAVIDLDRDTYNGPERTIVSKVAIRKYGART